jgi:hypothetical protein
MPPRQIRIACPKARATTLAGSTGTPLLQRTLRPPPRIQILYFFGYISNKSQKALDDLMGESPWFFYTCVRRLLTYWFNWLDTYESGVLLVVYEDVSIADLQCAITRP